MIAQELGWLCGARYTHLRDIKTFPTLGFLDIDWKNYNFDKHLQAAMSLNPMLTVARDIEDIRDLDKILTQAYILKKYSQEVIIVPKDLKLKNRLNEIPNDFLLGYSVPTQYGGTQIPVKYFTRPVHLLGGRPDVQRKLARKLIVKSLDCNRFTLDAKFGKYFDGMAFKKHPIGGYVNCLIDSLKNINLLWEDYQMEDAYGE